MRCGYSLKGELFVTLSSCETFSSGKGVFKAAKSMKHARTEFSVTTLPDGRVLAVGGDAYLNGETRVPGDAEIFTP